MELGKAFLDWSVKVKGNTERWVKNKAAHLEWWRVHLKGIDLRNAPIEKIEKPLVGATSVMHRIETIKSFYSWLITVERKLKPNEDPTFRTLKVPQAKPAQLSKVKATTQADYLEVRAKLIAHIDDRGPGNRPLFSQEWIDALDVLAGTGWHVTELERFADGGVIDHREAEGIAGVLVCPRTKGGVPLRTAVSATVLEAATRIREKGSFKGDALRTALQRACKRLGIPQVNPGSFRHSVATHAIGAGAEAGAAADFLGHRSEATTKRFYATHATPAKVPTLI
ncbi:tyrosine-type recombinase/integrase [Vulgatibacter incomptus]|uniref:tyrosine-type recombinase/integrase n=1 Tax=Vulgatibacter incomptus TaxID=1391653 RepID=UPI000681E141|nr:tyrosine-type recombinase/integrase [Vulgatibacter incomptus]